MDIAVHTQQGVTVVKFDGDLDLQTAPEFLQSVTPLIEHGSKILFDMHGLQYMSSAGLRVMLATHRQVTAMGARLILVGVSSDVKEVMSVTGFLQHFTLHDTVRDGLAALE